MSLVFVNNSELDKSVYHVHVRTVVFILAPYYMNIYTSHDSLGSWVWECLLTAYTITSKAVNAIPKYLAS